MDNSVRYPRLTPVQMSPRQHEVAEDIMNRRDGPTLSEPWAAMLYAPEIAALVQSLWDKLRFNLRLPEPVRQMAVIMTAARHGGADAALFVPAKDAIAALSDDKVKALVENRKPVGMTPDEALGYELCSQIIQTGRVKNALFERAIQHFDRQILIELTDLIANTMLMTTMLKVTGTRFS